MQSAFYSLSRFFSGLVVAMSAAAAFAQPTPVGTWKTIDDVTGKARGEVTITEQYGVLSGKVTNVLVDEKGSRTCVKCTDDRKDQPIIGLTVLRDLKKTDQNEWSGGNILDPENGKVYSAKMSLSDDGKKLNVRGFVGISLLGRTQTWIRD